MGFFGKLRRKVKKRKEQKHDKKIPLDGINKDSDSLTKASSSMSSRTYNGNDMKKKKMKKLGSFRSSDVTMDQLPDIVKDLEAGTDEIRAKTPKALKMLFALSEQPESHNRIEMARYDNGRIVTALLNILCSSSPQKSNEKYMALLVLNNISIPAENKQAVAITHDAVRVLSKLLCDDPSCHLIAIILVNLSFAEPEVLEELVSLDADTGLVEALSFVLHISSWSTEEFESHRVALEEGINNEMTPQARLDILIAKEDQRTYDTDTQFTSEQEKYPETTRWCLSALKNLSRVVENSSTVQALVHPMMLNDILKYITIPDMLLPHSESHGSDSSAETPVSREPTDEIINVPYLWDANSKQDAALYILVNICACSHSRVVLKDSEAIDVLLQIIYHANVFRSKKDLSTQERNQQDLQCLKSKMAIGFLLGSDGSFGHKKMKSTSSTVAANPPESPLVMTELDAELLVELLARSLHLRGKEGTAGYSATTMSTGNILFGLRCLMTHTSNQKLLIQVAGRILNSLLMKAIAIHTSRPGAMVDAKAAEYACFSLYLLSNYGFKNPFLPSWLDHEDEALSLSAKVLKSYIDMPSVTPLGKHSAEQLLFRLKFLVFEGEVLDLIPQDGERLTVTDVLFEEDIMDAMSEIQLQFLLHGAKPRKEIFDRSILRRRKPKDGNTAEPWDNTASVSTFSSALQAVQQLSFGSAKVRHVDGIDDVMIANNLAKCANGQRTEAYGYMWSWEDTASEIQLNMKRRGSPTAHVQEPVVSNSTFASNDTSSTIFSRLFTCGNVET
eukprot:CAMPEP_0113628566 /NCGR_PEP_ID=MMETSP0017_2-20120614/14803_1 /TAXON_ID=2856 /ORGANISM="Cylindrotheca closterium" /LENGTH=787 /DNA_ID=CAMNT_0000538879 /DNA_START=103 /DNA_END=2462 /DNA_ORIENTATION=- /assembly_acc=CAM_ASM_000147